MIHPPKYPTALKQGNEVYIIAPGSPFKRKRLYLATKWLKKRGYQVSFEKSIFQRQDYLAGKDQRRLSEFQKAWKRKKTRAIFLARGGYGCMRLALSPKFFISYGNKKLFMGFSDATVLLNYISKTTGLVTVHGPVLAGTMFNELSQRARHEIFAQLEDPKTRILRAGKDYQVLRTGNAQGRLWGGNLTLVQSTLGTKLEIPFQKALLFLEDHGEPRYRIDRMLAHLALQGALKQVRGVLLGDFSDAKGKPHSLSWLKKLILPLLPSGTPVLSGIRAGHTHAQVLLPIGGPAKILSNGRKIVFPPLATKS